MLKCELSAPEQTEAFGRLLATLLQPFASPILVGLQGPLGAGKTTLVRGLLRGLDVTGRVTSPTYTLIEPYETSAGPVFHLDLYRLADAGELEFVGLSDLLAAPGLLLIEWPERSDRLADQLNLRISLDYDGEGRTLCVDGTPEVLEALASSLADNEAIRP